MPSTVLNTTGSRRASATTRAVSLTGFQLKRSPGAVAGASGICRLASQPATATAISTPPASSGPDGPTSIRALPTIKPESMASWVPVSTSALPPINSAGASACGRIVLDRPKHGRVHAHEEQHHQQQANLVVVQAPARERHGGDLEQLDVADDAAFLELLRKLSGAGGKQ